MEFFTIFLSSLFGLISPTGLVVESAAEKAVRSQFAQVEKLQVRIDNAPTHQLLNGRVERIGIAGRGLQRQQLEMRVAVLELDARSCRSQSPQSKSAKTRATFTSARASSFKSARY